MSCRWFEPFGAGNPKLSFLRATCGACGAFVMKDKHLKLRLSDGKARTFEAVWWDGCREIKGANSQTQYSHRISYVPETNEWQGNVRLQLVVEDLRER